MPAPVPSGGMPAPFRCMWPACSLPTVVHHMACLLSLPPPPQVLENKLAEAKMKKDTLKARAQSAKSAAAINDMVRGGAGRGGAGLHAPPRYCG